MPGLRQETLLVKSLVTFSCCYMPVHVDLLLMTEITCFVGSGSSKTISNILEKFCPRWCEVAPYLNASPSKSISIETNDWTFERHKIIHAIHGQESLYWEKTVPEAHDRGHSFSEYCWRVTLIFFHKKTRARSFNQSCNNSIRVCGQD